MLTKLWEFIVRFRNWLVTIVGALLIVLPDILQMPELLMILPEEHHKWVYVAILVLNLAMRWRPAAMWHDPEVKIAKAMKDGEPGPNPFYGENV